MNSDVFSVSAHISFTFVSQLLPIESEIKSKSFYLL